MNLQEYVTAIVDASNDFRKTVTAAADAYMAKMEDARRAFVGEMIKSESEVPFKR